MKQFFFLFSLVLLTSCGGGGSPGSGWGRDKNEKDDDWARSCAKKASWLCKPVVKLKR